MPDLPVPAPDCAGCAARDEQIAALEAELREQADETAELRARVARLERALSRNSGNSSMPPSGDDAPGRKPPRKERRAAQREAEKKRKRGKQPGAGIGDELGRARRHSRSLPGRDVRVRR